MFELSALFFGLLSALSWGGGDFCGGLSTRRADPYAVVFVAEFVGAALLAALALIFGEVLPDLSHLLWGGAAGLIGAVGLLVLYQALASGHMGIVAPLTAVISGGVPVIFGLVTEGLPAPLQLGGFAMALAAVWLLAGGAGETLTRRDLVYTLVAGFSFGFYFIFIDRATGEGNVFWTLTVARSLGGLLILAAILGTRRPILPPRAALPLSAATGLLDAGGNLFFALAAVAGRLDVAAILASLYPGITVLLAWGVLGQRLNRPQVIGVAAALAAIVLIAV
jgi:drug/metabolite transporter (DMT)-like permease